MPFSTICYPFIIRCCKYTIINVLSVPIDKSYAIITERAEHLSYLSPNVSKHIIMNVICNAISANTRTDSYEQTHGHMHALSAVHTHTQTHRES